MTLRQSKGEPMDDDNRPFPIQSEWQSHGRWGVRSACEIPWWLADAAYAVYAKRYGTGQSLARLADRGGFGRQELLDLLRDTKPSAPEA